MTASGLANNIDYVVDYALRNRPKMDEMSHTLIDMMLYNLLTSDDYNRFNAEHPEWVWKEKEHEHEE